MDRRLNAILEELVGRELQELPQVARDAAKLLVYEVREGLPVEAAKAEAARMLGDDVDLALAAAEDAGLGRRAGLEREAVRLSYPTWLLEAFTNDFGPVGGAALAEAMNRRAPMALRVNTARISREALAARLAEST